MQLGDVTVETERGEVVDTIPFHLSRFLHIVRSRMSEADLGKTYCLQFIADYCDTTFNRFQSRVLVREIEELRPTGEPENERYLTTLTDLLTKYQDQTHLYVKFYGD